MPSSGVILAFLIPGLREVIVVTVVALALYGRGGHRLLMMTRYGRSVSPWLNLVRVPERSKARFGGRGRGRPEGQGPGPVSRLKPGLTAWLLRRGRWFWAVAITLAGGMAAWAATRMVIHASAGASR